MVLSITLRFYTKDLHEDKHLLSKELQIINRFVMTTLLDICLTRNFLSVQIYLCYDLSFALSYFSYFFSIKNLKRLNRFSSSLLPILNFFPYFEIIYFFEGKRGIWRPNETAAEEFRRFVQKGKALNWPEGQVGVVYNKIKFVCRYL